MSIIYHANSELNTQLKNLKQRQSGVTLLELLLVLVILAVLTTIGLNFYSRYSQDSKIKATATQMQLILQAASNYYLNNQCWPNGSNCPTNPPPPSFQSYLTFSLKTPWGGSYTYQPTPDNLKFQVVANNIPNQQSSMQYSVAQRIAALLPSAVAPACAQSSCTVQIEAAAPPASVNTPNTNYQIILIVQKDVSLSGSASTQTVSLPPFTCPAGWQQNVIGGIKSLTPNDRTDSNYPYCGSIFKVEIVNVAVTPAPCNPTTRVCNLQIGGYTYPKKTASPCVAYNDEEKEGAGDIGIIAIGYCCKLGQNGQCLSPS